MPKSLGAALGSVPALRYLVEKYGDPAGWPHVLATMPATTPAPSVCERCLGRGWITRPHPNPMAEVPIYRAEPCDLCHGGDAEYEANLWAKSGIERYEQEHMTFAAFNLKRNPKMAPALKAAQAWGAGDSLPFLVLRSAVKGVGKTHLAVAAAAGCIARHVPVNYCVVPSLMDELRATQRPGAAQDLESVRYRAERTQAVILDDLGAGKATDWADEQLFTIVNERYRRGLPTLVTTNAPLGALEERIRSRLCDVARSLVVPCDGKDQRLAG